MNGVYANVRHQLAALPHQRVHTPPTPTHCHTHLCNKCAAPHQARSHLNRQKRESHQHFKQDMAAPAHVLVQPEAHDYTYNLYTPVVASLMLCNNCMLTSIQQAYQVAAQAALKQLSYACYHDNNTKLEQCTASNRAHADKKLQDKSQSN